LRFWGLNNSDVATNPFFFKMDNLTYISRWQELV
jgi:hypothetical protein